METIGIEPISFTCKAKILPLNYVPITKNKNLIPAADSSTATLLQLT